MGYSPKLIPFFIRYHLLANIPQPSFYDHISEILANETYPGVCRRLSVRIKNLIHNFLLRNVHQSIQLDRVALQQFVKHSFNNTIKCHIEELALLLSSNSYRSLVNVFHIKLFLS